MEESPSVVDERFSAGPFFGEAAHQIAYLLAQALAVGSGYTDFEADRAGGPFAPFAMPLSVDEPSSASE